MTLSSGTRLGPYEILAPLGAGGMGEVYRARDTKLGREVAVKVLPEDFAQNEDRLALFEREARVLASLNHSHVATLYGFEQEGGTRFLVMELVEGEDLATQLRRGSLPLREALPLFLQVAEGLEAAHEKGIIHRDLKPANIKVTDDGTAKILDFGLAKAMLPATGVDDDLSQSPTLSATHHGEILGTAAYMSPEQALGKAVDKRTDIWAFGCCLYEALTGTRVFQADTVPQTLAKILEREPKWGALPQSTPARIRELLRRCLEKNPKQRLRDIGDARLEIAAALGEPAETGVRVEKGTLRLQALWGLIGALVGGSLVGALLWKGPQSVQPAAATRTTIRLAGDAVLALHPQADSLVAISRDGSRVVYVAQHGRTTQLYQRPLGRFEATTIPGTEGAHHFALSPDGNGVAFVADDYLQRVPLVGGEPKVLCEARTVGGVTWGEDEWIHFTRHSGELARVSAAGGDPEAVKYGVANPFALPGDAGVLVTVYGAKSMRADSLAIAGVSPEGQLKTVLEGGYAGRYIPTGHLIFMRGGQIFAAPFELDGLRTNGLAVPVLDGLWTDSIWATSQFSVSDDGTLVYVRGGDPARTVPTWIDREGGEEPLPLPPQVYENFRLSPDGRRLAVQVTGPSDQIHIYDFERATFTRLTLEASNAYPLWSADGRNVIFWRWTPASAEATAENSNWQSGLFRQPVDGGGEAQRLIDETDLHVTEPGVGLIPQSVSPDGRLLVFSHEHRKRRGDIWLLSLDGSGHFRELIATEGQELAASVSPDGRYVAFVSNKTGRLEIFVRPFPEGDGEWQVSGDGGFHPLWSPRGDELFYRDEKRLMVVPVSSDPEFRAGQARVLFERDDFGMLAARSYDVAPDGGRILIGKTVSPTRPVTELQVVMNWFEELKEKMREAEQ